MAKKKTSKTKKSPRRPVKSHPVRRATVKTKKRKASKPAKSAARRVPPPTKKPFTMTLPAAFLMVLPDRLTALEKRFAQFESSFDLYRKLREHDTISKPEKKTKLLDEAPKTQAMPIGVTITEDGIEIDEDEAWRWGEPQMFFIAEWLDDPELLSDMKEAKGKPRRVRQILFDFMRAAGLKPREVPPSDAQDEPGTSGMAIAVTTTRTGITSEQAKTFRRLLDEWGVTELHHGDCVGGDEDAHEIASKIDGMRIYVHPPDDDSKRAHCEGPVAKVFDPKPYHERNHDMVNTTARLIAMPKTDVEELRSGTWATVRYAKKHNKPVVIIKPDGTAIGRI